jgi:hypothetical protein
VSMVEDPRAGERYTGHGRRFRLPDAPWDAACSGTPVQGEAGEGADVVCSHAGPWCPVCEWDHLAAETWAQELKKR